jgi:citronellol/citronellal dehydrogenase
MRPARGPAEGDGSARRGGCPGRGALERHGRIDLHAVATKVENLTRMLTIERARFGIRLTAVAAGHFATDTLMAKYGSRWWRAWPSRCHWAPRHGGGVRLARRLPGQPRRRLVSGAILTLDGARDNWFESWPPGGMTDSAGQPLAEEREPRP